MEDDSGKADRLREVGVEVERREVERSPRVAVRRPAVGGDPELGEAVAGGEAPDRPGAARCRGGRRSGCADRLADQAGRLRRALRGTAVERRDHALVATLEDDLAVAIDRLRLEA